MPERLGGEEPCDGVDRCGEVTQVGSGLADHVVTREGGLVLQGLEHLATSGLERGAGREAVGSSHFEPGPGLVLPGDDVGEVGGLGIGVNQQDPWCRECFVGGGSVAGVGDPHAVGQAGSGLELELREIDGEVLDGLASAQP